MTSNKHTLKSIDKPILILYLLLIIIGLFNIYSVEYAETQKHFLDFNTGHGKQFVFIISSFLIAAALLIIDVRFFTGFAWVIYGLTLFLLVAVLFFGVEINATKAWFRIGGLSFQPSEIAKYGTALALASFIGKQKNKNASLNSRIKAYAVIIFPAMLVLLQKDVGTTLVFTSFILVLFREGYVSGFILFFGGLAIGLFVLTLLFNEFLIIGVMAGIIALIAVFMRKKPKAIYQLAGVFLMLSLYIYSVDYAMENVLEPHHKARIEVLLYEGVDLQGAGYNLHQSKIAIGSGGLTGKGYMQGTQTRFNFVPEQTTDFIFCTIGEEWGFFGSSVMIILFIALIWRLIHLAEKQKSAFSRAFGYAAASVIFFHFAINIGMTIGLVPVIGIPLPMISAGGSSLWGVTLLIFTFLRLDTKRLEML